ncbi:MAG: alpha/beta fold hydrolase, partial [Dehalococcoidia bacterium]|nr:alpha/beta fold hydrolase [Dehalococcoidia bacterium]
VRLMPPRVQFATTDDGVRIAYTVTGEGPPLFWLPHFLASHVQLEWEFPQKFVYTRLAEQFTVVRFDCRGLGLSDRDVEDISLEARMRDLEAVARKIGAARFAVVGIEGGGNLATAYAIAHPERVSHLVLINWSPRFRDEASGARLSALGLLVRQDWEMLAQNIGGVAFGYDAPAAAGYARLVRASVNQPMAIRYGDLFVEEDLLPLLPEVAVETLVLHSEENSYASETSARTVAASIPDASFRTFEGGLPRHIFQLLDAIKDFVPAAPAARAMPVGPAPLPDAVPLTERELEILVLVARGLSNREMADQLVLSPRTIERHLENLYRKTGARNRAEATAYAFTRGLVEQPG